MKSNHDKLLKEFGKNLRSLRIKTGLSTRDFAMEAEISHSSLGRLESGRTNPSMTTLIKLADVLGTDINTLVPGK